MNPLPHGIISNKSSTIETSVIGVLAIQGDFDAHARVLERIGLRAFEVRRADDLREVDGLIIPGGESTTMLKFIMQEDLGPALIDFAKQGKVVFGTCAGAILLAREVSNPPQTSLGLIDIEVERNAYGRQVDSFIAEVETTLDGGPLEAVFIRAPVIRSVGPDVEVLANVNSRPALVRERNVLAATFHPELTDDQRVHRLFAEMVASSRSNRNEPAVVLG
ncbi:MAG TPA: pyridoxal 5'-phosphate synthase glutaminase subunit PdxT [Blastocatellia bacterium]|nr:pyridoxal 5'-phosphate synthase glutaminase subunit PdxT [Blastocatellia bacterium]